MIVQGHMLGMQKNRTERFEKETGLQEVGLYQQISPSLHLGTVSHLHTSRDELHTEKDPGAKRKTEFQP